MRELVVQSLIYIEVREDEKMIASNALKEPTKSQESRGNLTIELVRIRGKRN